MGWVNSRIIAILCENKVDLACSTAILCVLAFSISHIMCVIYFIFHNHGGILCIICVILCDHAYYLCDFSKITVFLYVHVRNITHSIVKILLKT